MIKKIFFSLLLFVALSGALSQHVAAQQSDQHELLTVRLTAGQEKIISVDQPFEAFALSEVEDVEVRFFQGNGWTDWQHLELEEEDITGSELIFVAPTSVFSLRANSDMSIKVTMIQVLDIPTQVVLNDDLALDVGVTSAVDDQVAAAPKIISRWEWGADESLGVYTPDGNSTDSSASESDPEVAPGAKNICAPLENAYPGQYQISDHAVETNDRGELLVWPREYSSSVKKIIIHHTAQSVRDFDNNGAIDSSDYRTAIQAIYVYHTLTRHWGDIGYHYLVDPAGNIYEGRAGGAGVIGAQALCQNSNTVGVSVMGNFDVERVPENEFIGLVRIVKYLTDLHRLNPMGKSSFRGAILPNIVTHAEVGDATKVAIGQGATACPGGELKSMMPRLRQVVADGGVRPDYGYSIVSLPKSLTLDPLQTSSAVIRIKNTGAQTWKKVELSSVGNATGFISKDMLNVASDQETEISIPLMTGLEGGTKRMSFTVQLDGSRQKKKIEFSYKVNKPLYRYEVLNFEGKQDSLLVGEKRTIAMKLKNTGNFPWLVEGKQRFQLRQVNRKNDAVESSAGGFALSLKNTVPVGGEANFSIEIPAQQRAGQFRLEFLPSVAVNKGLKGDKLMVSVDIEVPKFAAVIESVDRKVRADRGFSKLIDFQVVNKGNFDWESGMVWYRIGSGEKQFINQVLERGKTIRFPVAVSAGYDDRSVTLNGTIGIDHLPKNISAKNFRKSTLSFKKLIQATGTVRLAAEKVSQSRDLLPAERGQYQEWVEFRNTGSVPWYREGKDRMTLVVKGKADFGRLGLLEKEIVKPGEIGKFLITLKISIVPKRTTYDDFALMVGTKTVKLSGKMRFGVEVQGTREVNEKSRADVEQASLSPTAADQKTPAMRVLLTEANQEEFQISSPGTFIFWDSKTVQIREQAAEQVVTVRTSDLSDGVVIRLKAKDSPYLQFKNWDREKVFGSQRYNDNRYRGVLEFRLIDGKMTVINELALEDYMKGVAEVPETDDQPEDKRKVIAVLSRSYALHYLISGYEKFPGQPYNAADSPAIFQKYLGYSFEERAPKWQQVLIDTEGEVVLMGDEVLRAAYFSCTDGSRTKSWDEVWPENEYFQKFGDAFQSVNDPLGDDPTREGMTACGHQVGLSGYGATQKAKAGEGYRDIIQYYYQGVEVGEFNLRQ